jgi:hypothetical protein
MHISRFFHIKMKMEKIAHFHVFAELKLPYWIQSALAHQKTASGFTQGSFFGLVLFFYNSAFGINVVEVKGVSLAF